VAILRSSGKINTSPVRFFVAFPILGSSTWKDDEAQLVVARLLLIISEDELGAERQQLSPISSECRMGKE
jgi:hypothetical protein